MESELSAYIVATLYPFQAGKLSPSILRHRPAML